MPHDLPADGWDRWLSVAAVALGVVLAVLLPRAVPSRAEQRAPTPSVVVVGPLGMRAPVG